MAYFRNITADEINEILKKYTGINADFDIEIGENCVRAASHPTMNKSIYAELNDIDVNVLYVGFSDEYVDAHTDSRINRSWRAMIFHRCKTNQEKLEYKCKLPNSMLSPIATSQI